MKKEISVMCAHCDQEIYVDETAFDINGETYCPDCFREYVTDYLDDLEEAARLIGVPFWTVGDAIVRRET